MEDEYAFYIDQQGIKISSREISSHIGLAQQILDSNEELKKEFEKSKMKYADEFLVSQKGYMKGSVMGNCYRIISYDASHLSDAQKSRLAFYVSRGFTTSRLSTKERDEER